MDPDTLGEYPMKSLPAAAVYIILLIVYAFHNDLWLWSDSSLVFGLPVGLAYHVAYSLFATVLMYGIVRYAWPAHLDAEDAGEGRHD